MSDEVIVPATGDVPAHTIDRTPEYEAFLTRLREYHEARGTPFDPEPKVGPMNLDLLKVFNHIVAAGGYDKVSEEKLAWRRMASELGIYSTNEAGTAFALKEKFYKNLAAYEISTVHGKEPPPKDILEDVTAKGASLLTRTRENYKGKRESAIGTSAHDSAASGDDGTPVKEKPTPDVTVATSARASRGLREAPPQRIIFHPDTGSSRTTRGSGANHTNSPAPSQSTPSHNSQQQSQPSQLQPQQRHQHHHNPNMNTPQQLNQRGPSILNHPSNGDSSSHLVASYQPKHSKPLQLRAVATPSNAPTEFQKPRPQQRYIPDPRQPLLPGTGYDGPNIYTRCLQALRSSILSEQRFALNHLVKISFERGDKYKFDSFPGLAEGLINKALQVGKLFYHVNWAVSWDLYNDSTDVGVLDGNNGTRDILEKISNLCERDVPAGLQSEDFTDELILITEAVLTIRNMMTLSDNAYTMSDFHPLKDLICIITHLPQHDSLTEMKHLALDIAEQLTPWMTLDSSDPLYKTLLSQMTSADRGIILTALRALGRISVNLEATNTLKDVPVQVLQRISHWLLLNDDELMDACLDFLYQYTAVVSNVDKLVRSLTPESLVDHLVRLMSHGARKVRREITLTPEKKLPSRDMIAPIPEDLLQDLLKLEEPDRVHKWVKCFFELDSDSFVTQLSAWQAYQAAFTGPLKTIGQPLITPADFIRNSTTVYKGSIAQVLREPGDPQQKFIIHGLRARARPLSLCGVEYGRCLWATNLDRKNEKCGHFFLKPEQMWNHIMAAHLDLKRNADGLFDNIEKDFRCTWAECKSYDKPTKLKLSHFASHIRTHVTAMLTEIQPDKNNNSKSWIIPATTMSTTYEETQTARDERNPNAPLQAAGIPLSAVLILRNIARNVVKTEAEDELIKEQSAHGRQGGWNEKLFRPLQPRLFEILTENKAMSPYIASLLELISIKIVEDSD